MSMGEQGVYLGNKRYTRRVWNICRDSEGRIFGFVRLPKQQESFKVWLQGDFTHGHWTTQRDN